MVRWVVYSPKMAQRAYVSVDYGISPFDRCAKSRLAIHYRYNITDLIVRGVSTIPGALGPITQNHRSTANLSRADLDGIDYEAIIFWTRRSLASRFWQVYFTVNGTT